MFRIIYLPTAECVINGDTNSNMPFLVVLTFETEELAKAYINRPASVFRFLGNKFLYSYYMNNYLPTKYDIPKYLLDVVEVDDV